MPGRRHPAGGFTLVELLVVVAIIGILVMLLLSAVMSSRAAARRVQCQNRLRQVGTALHIHHAQQQYFPAGSHKEWSWIGKLLPFLEQEALFDQLDFGVEPFLPPNDEFIGALLPALQCPDDPERNRVFVATSMAGQEFTHTNFLGTYDGKNDTSRGMFGRDMTNSLRDVADGSSNTLFVGERGVVIKEGVTSGWWCWGGIRDTYLSANFGFRAGDTHDAGSANHWWSFHPDGAHFLFVDGHVAFLPYSMDAGVFRALGSKDGGEKIDDF